MEKMVGREGTRGQKEIRGQSETRGQREIREQGGKWGKGRIVGKVEIKKEDGILLEDSEEADSFVYPVVDPK